MLRRSPSAVNISDMDVADMRRGAELYAENLKAATEFAEANPGVAQPDTKQTERLLGSLSDAPGSVSHTGDVSTATAATSDSNATVKP